MLLVSERPDVPELLEENACPTRQLEKVAEKLQGICNNLLAGIDLLFLSGISKF